MPLQLETKRLLFQRYTVRDLPFIEELVTNAAVMATIGTGLPQDKQYAQQFLARMQQQYTNFDEYGLHALVEKESGAYIGHAGFVAQLIDDCFEIELGYWIHPRYWQQGYASEATAALVQYAVEEWEIERFVSQIMAHNIASMRIAEKNGLHYEKTIVSDGKTTYLYVYEIEVHTP